jgi:hypothetical protein
MNGCRAWPSSPSRLFLPLFLLLSASAFAQGNYEIQVYPSETVAPDSLMVEVHSNYTVDGQKTIVDGTQPTNHAEHETLELTQGLTDWAEVGFYVFTSETYSNGVQWVGDHIRPRVRVPPSWHWPVGVSLSTEIGYQRATFSADTWTWEIRPIIDKTQGRWYWSINPALERAWHGPSVNQGLEFSPNVKVSYDITKKVAAGIEYYGAFGDLRNFDTLHNQQQQIFAAADLNVSPKWEFNLVWESDPRQVPIVGSLKESLDDAFPGANRADNRKACQKG